MQYLFGDSDIAARRLNVVADLFAESSKAFLLEAVTAESHLAVDLGCGPGYSTHLLADVLKCDHTVGLDSSEHFISLAEKTKTEKVSFYLHDVTRVPFPVGPGDLMYCRFLLTHLREPHAAVGRWATQLRPRGRLLMEEVEWIRTDSAVFSTYLRIVEAMLEHHSNALYVGPILNSMEDSDILAMRMSRVSRVSVESHRAATMFFLNMQSWKNDPFVQAGYSEAHIEQLEGDLRSLMNETTGDILIEWGLRQLAYERA